MHQPARHCPALADPVLCTSIRRTATACHQKCARDFIKERMTAEETVLVVGCAHSRTLKGNERLLLMELIKTGGAPRGECGGEETNTFSFANSQIGSDTMAEQHSRVQDVSGLGKHRLLTITK